jgi:hypothetical protein
MKKVPFLFLVISLFSNEFVIRKTEVSTNETRVALREKIACFSGDLLNNACVCMRREIKKANGNGDKNFCEQIDVIVELQQDFLSMIREILDQAKCWKRVARTELQKLQDFLSQLNDEFLDEHDYEWWKKQRDLLKKMIPHS